MTTKKARKVDDINVPDAILSKDPMQRLNALVRRHGGKSVKEGGAGRKVVLPPIGKWGEIPDQMTLEDELPEPPL